MEGWAKQLFKVCLVAFLCNCSIKREGYGVLGRGQGLQLPSCVTPRDMQGRESSSYMLVRLSILLLRHHWFLSRHPCTSAKLCFLSQIGTGCFKYPQL